MLLRIAIVVAFLAPFIAAFSFYAVRRTVKLVPGLRPRAPWLWAFSIFCLVFQIVLYGLRTFPALWGVLGVPFWIAYFLFGLFMTFLLYLAAADIVWGLVRLMFRLPATWGKRVWEAVAVVSLVSAFLGLIYVLVPQRIVRVEVPVRNLPHALDGFTIVQLSDLHVGAPLRRAMTERIVNRANALDPDLILITGDIIHAPAPMAAEDAEPLKGLRATHGTYAVTGNHDSPAWLPELSRMGIRVLSNQHAMIDHRGAALWLVGLPGFQHVQTGGAASPNIAEAVRDVPANAVKILLVHDPNKGPGVAAAHGFQLQLSGHTHGGQFFPWGPVLTAFMHYKAGIYREGETRVYVNRGTGWWGPPDRFLVPSEITLITLRAPAGSISLHAR